MKKETIYNLQCDWDGELEGFGIHSEDTKREIKRLVAFEVDAFRNQSWWRRALNMMPEWNPFKKNKKS